MTEDNSSFNKILEQFRKYANDKLARNTQNREDILNEILLQAFLELKGTKSVSYDGTANIVTQDDLDLLKKKFNLLLKRARCSYYRNFSYMPTPKKSNVAFVSLDVPPANNQDLPNIGGLVEGGINSGDYRTLIYDHYQEICSILTKKQISVLNILLSGKHQNPHELWRELKPQPFPCCLLCRSYRQWNDTGRYAGRAADQVRACHQSQDRQGARAKHTSGASTTRR